MKKSPRPSSKYSLVFATLIAFSCVCTAGVSTFAWFQASSAVTINTTSDTANITVSAPDELDLADPVLYAYNSNFTYDAGAYTNHGYVNAIASANVADDFTELNTLALKNALLNTNMLTPGRKLSFAIKAVASSNISQADFYLERYTSTRLLNRKKMSDVNTDSNYPIAMDEAIRIYSSVNSSGNYIEPNTNHFNFDYATAATTTTVDSGNNIQTKIYDSNAAFTRVNLGGENSIASETVYFFFTIEFSNSNTTYYQEYSGLGGEILSRPNSDYASASIYNSGQKYYSESAGEYSYASPQPADQTAINEGAYYTASDRYFLSSASGKSNCYAGLTFQINRIQLELI